LEVRVVSKRNQLRRCDWSIQFSRSEVVADNDAVFVKLGEHVLRSDEDGVVVGDALEAGDFSDGVDGEAADFADAFGNLVGDGVELVGVIIEQEVVVAEVGAGHVPVEVFGFEIDGEDIGEESVEGSGDVCDGFGSDVGGEGEGLGAAGGEFGFV
jgi:hypothetical protein